MTTVLPEERPVTDRLAEALHRYERRRYPCLYEWASTGEEFRDLWRAKAVELTAELSAVGLTEPQLKEPTL